MSIFLIIGLLVSTEMYRKKSSRKLNQERRNYNVAALRNYVTTNLRKGYTKEQIKNAMIKNNYNNEDVDEAFKRIK